jgi:hypothetical protein
MLHYAALTVDPPPKTGIQRRVIPTELSRAANHRVALQLAHTHGVAPANVCIGAPGAGRKAQTARVRGA